MTDGALHQPHLKKLIVVRARVIIPNFSGYVLYFIQILPIYIIIYYVYIYICAYPHDSRCIPRTLCTVASKAAHLLVLNQQINEFPCFGTNLFKYHVVLPTIFIVDGIPWRMKRLWFRCRQCAGT